MAALEHGDASAQYELGLMCGLDEGVSKDAGQAYIRLVPAGVWFTEAEAPPKYDLAVRSRRVVAAGMTPAQIAEARRPAREWSLK